MPRHASSSFLLLLLLSVSSLFSYTHARAILGVDLGSLYMKVALVQSGAPLEIVTNLHSKRKTEQMILFDQQQRFYGADASALLARKSQKTPAAMSLLLGRDEQHPVVQVLAERHYPVTPSYNETRSGVTLTVDGSTFTPEELVAMVLSHAVDISVAHAASQGSTLTQPPTDIVLTVPSFATARERQALLDAADLAGLNVLTLIDETTAAALQYAMDKTFVNDKDESDDQLFLFYNMGASAVQVSLVHFYSQLIPQKYGKPKRVPSLTVLAKAWDETCGGLAFDHLLVEHLADLFNEQWRTKTSDSTKDIRTVPRAMTKLRLQANKVKHVLSANTDIPVHMDALHDDISLSTHVSRQQLEELAAPLLERALQPVSTVLQHANKTWSDVTGVELIGGGMRIPRIQAELSKMLQESQHLELGLHMNADESMALGAAFAGANISTAFRVRQVGMTDLHPFELKVDLSNVEEKSEEEWSKNAVLFPAYSKVGIKKSIRFKHDQDIVCALDYGSENLPAGSEHGLVRYKISGVPDFAKEMTEKGLTEEKPQVSLQFELSTSGIASLVKAEVSMVEVYTVQEEVEIEEEEETKEGEKDDEKEDDAKEEKEDEEAKDKGDKKEGEGDKSDSDTEKKEEKKEKKTKLVEKLFGIRNGGASKPTFLSKERKRTHKKTLSVETTYVGRVQPHSPEVLAESKAKLLEMATKDKERMMLEEAKNNLESYIYSMKNTLTDREDEIAKVTTPKQREATMKLALDAQEWMDDEGYAADLATTKDKHASLSDPFEKILLRLTELEARPKAVEDAQKKMKDVEELLKKWETSKPHITEEERKEVIDKIAEVKKWIEGKEKAQNKKKDHDDPAFLSHEVPEQLKPVESLVMRLSKKPKPKPPKKEENATDAGNETDATAGGEEEEKASADDAASSEESSTEPKEEQDAPSEEGTANDGEGEEKSDEL